MPFDTGESYAARCARLAQKDGEPYADYQARIDADMHAWTDRHQMLDCIAGLIGGVEHWRPVAETILAKHGR